MVERVDTKVFVPQFFRGLPDKLRSFMDWFSQANSVDNIPTITYSGPVSWEEIQSLCSRTGSEGHIDGIIRM